MKQTVPLSSNPMLSHIYYLLAIYFVLSLKFRLNAGAPDTKPIRPDRNMLQLNQRRRALGKFLQGYD